MSDSKSTFPTFAKFWRTARWLLLTIALVYGLLWMRYATVERVLAFDPVVAMNAGFADVPVEDRGWPEMRKALVAMQLTIHWLQSCFVRPAAVRCLAFTRSS